MWKVKTVEIQLKLTWCVKKVSIVSVTLYPSVCKRSFSIFLDPRGAEVFFMLERKGGNWLPFNAQLDLSTTKALISKSVINTKYIFNSQYF